MISKYKLTFPIKTFFSSLFLWSNYSIQINLPFLSPDFGSLFWGTFPHATVPVLSSGMQHEWYFS